MTATNLNMFRQVIKEELKPINEKLDAHGKQLDAHGKQLDAQGKKIDAQGEKIDAQGEKIDAQGKKLDTQGRKLDILWDQVEKVTVSLAGIEEKLDSHSTILRRIEQKVENNYDDTGKLNKRLTIVEHHLGIVAPPELTLVR